MRPRIRLAATGLGRQRFVANPLRFRTLFAQAVLDGSWKTSATWGGLKDGFVKLEGYGPAVPNDVKQFVQAKEKDMIAGKLTPFDGPVKDNEGKVRLEKGPMSDDSLNKMNYFVEGVAGKLPKN
jgi:simple sugar transport system substrate-binding protein